MLYGNPETNFVDVATDISSGTCGVGLPSTMPSFRQARLIIKSRTMHDLRAFGNPSDGPYCSFNVPKSELSKSLDNECFPTDTLAFRALLFNVAFI